jgi:hypothetical protein
MMDSSTETALEPDSSRCPSISMRAEPSSRYCPGTCTPSNHAFNGPGLTGCLLCWCSLPLSPEDTDTWTPTSRPCNDRHHPVYSSLVRLDFLSISFQKRAQHIGRRGFQARPLNRLLRFGGGRLCSCGSQRQKSSARIMNGVVEQTRPSGRQCVPMSNTDPGGANWREYTNAPLTRRSPMFRFSEHTANRFSLGIRN